MTNYEQNEKIDVSKSFIFRIYNMFYLRAASKSIHRLKEAVFFFHAVVLAGTLQSTDFKSIYSNQFKRYEYIQGIWEMQKFMKNTMTKTFLARAHFRARG